MHLERWSDSLRKSRVVSLFLKWRYFGLTLICSSSVSEKQNNRKTWILTESLLCHVIFVLDENETLMFQKNLKFQSLLTKGIIEVSAWYLVPLLSTYLILCRYFSTVVKSTRLDDLKTWWCLISSKIRYLVQSNKKVNSSCCQLY